MKMNNQYILNQISYIDHLFSHLLEILIRDTIVWWVDKPKINRKVLRRLSMNSQ